MTTVTVPGLPFDLEPDGEPAGSANVTDTGLVLTGGAGTDLFVDPAGSGSPEPSAGRLLGVPPAGDFTLAARVTVDFAATYDAGVLLLYADPHLFAKLCFEYSPAPSPMAVTVVTRGESDDSNAWTVDGNSLWLRITRTGSAWAFHASIDGKHWEMLRYFALGVDDVRVGFMAQSPTGTGCAATFEHISFQAGAPADLRDGS